MTEDMKKIQDEIRLQNAEAHSNVGQRMKPDEYNKEPDEYNKELLTRAIDKLGTWLYEIAYSVPRDPSRFAYLGDDAYVGGGSAYPHSPVTPMTWREVRAIADAIKKAKGQKTSRSHQESEGTMIPSSQKEGPLSRKRGA